MGLVGTPADRKPQDVEVAAASSSLIGMTLGSAKS
jgi:hypothetical protein